MKVIIDQIALRRRATLAHTASLGGLLVLLGSVAVSMWKPDWTALAAFMLFGGFAVSVVGIYFANRWVKRPRPEEVLKLALKSLSDVHRMYHYTSLGDHLLLTPNGVVVIEVVTLDGDFTYVGRRWKQKMSISRATRFLVEERLGDPILRAQADAAVVKGFLEQAMPDGKQVPVQAVVVFTHPYAKVQVEGSPIPVLIPEKLLKKLPRPSAKLEPEIYQHIREKLDALLPGAGG